MKKLNGILFCIILFVCSCNTSNNNGSKITLQPNFKTGDAYQLDYQMDMSQKVMGMDNKIQMAMGYKLNIKDASATNGYNMNMMFSRIMMNVKSPAMSVNFDSDKNDKMGASGNSPADKMKAILASTFSGMLGKSVSVNMANTGEVKSVTGFQELLQGVVDSTSGNLPGAKERMKNAMSGMMNEDQVKQVFQQSFSVYPQKPVAIGDTWAKDFTINQNNMKMKTTTNYKLVSANDNEAILDLDGTVGTDGDSKMENGGVKMSMEMKGTLKGKVTVDVKTGFVKEGNITENINAKVEAAGQKIPMDMVMDINIKGKKL